MLLPLHDTNERTFLRYPWVNWGLIAACFVVFLYQIGGSEQHYVQTIYGFGMVPALLSGDAQLPAGVLHAPAWLTLVTAQFLHGGWMHLLGNMLFLFVFGDNVEDSMGHRNYLAFYLTCGVAAGLSQYATSPDPGTPMIGASGAISGVLGAYLLLSPKAKVLVPIGFIPLYIPAWLLLIFWFALQLFSAAGDTAGQAGVAWWAHIGGFLAGMVLLLPFKRRAVPLFGGEKPPRGLRVVLPKRRRERPETGSPRGRSGPWG
ncbi:Membrane associated serine protease, rhomboid family [Tistlia consotensis]|uniref:Membrane associated serine protease, rhomboid family n=2 Tax=Tistlia TaxID=1321364 RepID=A0A1Y6BKV1_9PROT|nr:Membrane associated serine protease, rhomboid family [Tistlia consotensis USBA 355]SNR49593.1 Membrane associated serine protease, rhomboid family [Tistlia consotensis]